MLTTRIYSEVWDIDARLKPFGATRAELIDIARAVVAARADAVEDDPVTAEGLFAYIFGTRALRGVFRRKKWLRYREENIESVRHPKKDLKIIYQSVDLAASKFYPPRAVSGKGSGAKGVIDSAQGGLFSDEQLAAANPIKLSKIDSGAWFFCVSVNGDDVRAELSLPSGVEAGNFDDFIERIFIIGEGDWAEILAKPDLEKPIEFEPIVTRKR